MDGVQAAQSVRPICRVAGAYDLLQGLVLMSPFFEIQRILQMKNESQEIVIGPKLPKGESDVTYLCG
jgi:hypothetical protein